MAFQASAPQPHAPQPYLNTKDPSTIIPVPTPDYYSTNTFQFSENGTDALAWLVKIGPSNVSYLTKIFIYIHSAYTYPDVAAHARQEVTPWCRFLNRLSTHARGLKDIKIVWNARFNEDGSLRYEGGGADSEVVKCLAQIQGLDRLEIGGYFRREWPSYLQQRMGLHGIWVAEGKGLDTWRNIIGDVGP